MKKLHNAFYITSVVALLGVLLIIANYKLLHIKSSRMFLRDDDGWKYRKPRTSDEMNERAVLGKGSYGLLNEVKDGIDQGIGRTGDKKTVKHNYIGKKLIMNQETGMADDGLRDYDNVNSNLSEGQAGNPMIKMKRSKGSSDTYGKVFGSYATDNDNVDRYLNEGRKRYIPNSSEKNSGRKNVNLSNGKASAFSKPENLRDVDPPLSSPLVNLEPSESNSTDASNKSNDYKFDYLNNRLDNLMTRVNSLISHIEFEHGHRKRTNAFNNSVYRLPSNSSLAHTAKRERYLNSTKKTKNKQNKPITDKEFDMMVKTLFSPAVIYTRSPIMSIEKELGERQSSGDIDALRENNRNSNGNVDVIKSKKSAGVLRTKQGGSFSPIILEDKPEGVLPNREGGYKNDSSVLSKDDGNRDSLNYDHNKNLGLHLPKNLSTIKAINVENQRSSTDGLIDNKAGPLHKVRDILDYGIVKNPGLVQPRLPESKNLLFNKVPNDLYRAKGVDFWSLLKMTGPDNLHDESTQEMPKNRPLDGSMLKEPKSGKLSILTIVKSSMDDPNDSSNSQKMGLSKSIRLNENPGSLADMNKFDTTENTSKASVLAHLGFSEENKSPFALLNNDKRPSLEPNPTKEKADKPKNGKIVHEEVNVSNIKIVPNFTSDTNEGNGHAVVASLSKLDRYSLRPKEKKSNKHGMDNPNKLERGGDHHNLLNNSATGALSYKLSDSTDFSQRKKPVSGLSLSNVNQIVDKIIYNEQARASNLPIEYNIAENVKYNQQVKGVAALVNDRNLNVSGKKPTDKSLNESKKDLDKVESVKNNTIEDSEEPIIIKLKLHKDIESITEPQRSNLNTGASNIPKDVSGSKDDLGLHEVLKMKSSDMSLSLSGISDKRKRNNGVENSRSSSNDDMIKKGPQDVSNNIGLLAKDSLNAKVDKEKPLDNYEESNKPIDMLDGKYGADGPNDLDGDKKVDLWNNETIANDTTTTSLAGEKDENKRANSMEDTYGKKKAAFEVGSIKKLDDSAKSEDISSKSLGNTTVEKVTESGTGRTKHRFVKVPVEDNSSHKVGLATKRENSKNYSGMGIEKAFDSLNTESKRDDTNNSKEGDDLKRKSLFETNTVSQTFASEPRSASVAAEPHIEDLSNVEMEASFTENSNDGLLNKNALSTESQTSKIEITNLQNDDTQSRISDFNLHKEKSPSKDDLVRRKHDNKRKISEVKAKYDKLKDATVGSAVESNDMPPYKGSLNIKDKQNDEIGHKKDEINIGLKEILASKTSGLTLNEYIMKEKKSKKAPKIRPAAKKKADEDEGLLLT